MIRTACTQSILRSSPAWLAALISVAALADPPLPQGQAGAPPAGAVAEQPVDQGISMRPAVLREMPDINAKSVGQLAPNTPVLLFERARLWVRVRPLNAPQAPAAWASLLDFRFGAAPAAAAARPAASAPGGGAFAGFSRSVSSLLAGFGGRQNSYGGNTATIGIRGLTSQELGSAAPNYQAYAEIERFTTSPQDAQHFALAGGLVPQRLTYLAVPVAAPAPSGGPPSPTGTPRPTPFR